MAIFLKLREQAYNTPEWFIAGMFSSLSPRWYPTNIISSTVYDIFKVYAQEFSSGAVELTQVYNDFFLENVRTHPVYGEEYTKIYNNFGVLYGVTKLFIQNFNTYNNVYGLQSYRNELKFLINGYNYGTTIGGVNDIGRAFTGMAPKSYEFIKDYPGWSLTSYTSSVRGIGNTFVVLQDSIPRYGNVLPYPEPSDFVKTGTLGSTDVTFYNASLSFSKLGFNTKIYTKQHYYSQVDTTIFTSSSSSLNDTFTSQVATSINNVTKVGQFANLSYSPNYVVWSPLATWSTGSYGSFTLSEFDYLYNNTTGLCSITSSVLSLPDGYGNYNWYYDWAVRNFNDTTYTIGIREYSNSTIPSTVYFEEITDTPINYLPTLETNSLGHWIFDNYTTAYDISGSQNSLTYVGTYNSSYGPYYTRARKENTVTTYSPYGSTNYTKIVQGTLITGNPMYYEMWVKGFDARGTFNYVLIKLEKGGSMGASLSEEGTMFLLDGSGTLSFTVHNGISRTTVSGDVSSYLLESPSRYHYFAGTYCDNIVTLYADGNVIASASIPEVPTYILADSLLSVEREGTYIAVDEAVCCSGFLTPELAKAHFEATKPRRSSTLIPSGSVERYCQAQLTADCYGIKEVEWYNFSIRGDRKTPTKRLQNSDFYGTPTGSVVFVSKF